MRRKSYWANNNNNNDESIALAITFVINSNSSRLCCPEWQIEASQGRDSMLRCWLCNLVACSPTKWVIATELSVAMICYIRDSFVLRSFACFRLCTGTECTDSCCCCCTWIVVIHATVLNQHTYRNDVRSTENRAKKWEWSALWMIVHLETSDESRWCLRTSENPSVSNAVRCRRFVGERLFGHPVKYSHASVR